VQKENSGGGEFNCDIFDILCELFKMPQCIPGTTIKKKSDLNYFTGKLNIWASSGIV
jgi:hypothetical protein